MKKKNFKIVFFKVLNNDCKRIKVVAILVVLGVFFFLPVEAQTDTDQVKTHYTESIPLSYIFTILFLTLGPFKIIAPFAKITEGADPRLAQKIAILGSLFSCVALLIAAFLGGTILNKFDISLPLLALSAGIILFLVALLAIIQQFKPPEPGETKIVPSLKMAVMPLAFPNIVTPYGIALLIVFLALAPDFKSQLTIGAMVFGIMGLNLVLMILSRKIYDVLGMVLAILGAVLGIVQVALGLRIIIKSLKVIYHS
ncbi:MAG: MarC family protein [Chitinophagales bacterium]